MAKAAKVAGKAEHLLAQRAAGPSSKAQLAQLVAKLDTLTAKPLTIQLSSEQKKQVHAVLTEIGMLGEMNDDDAKVKLDTLLRLLEDQKETFVAAGFAWPGYREPGRPPGAPLQNANIFRIGPDLEHFKSLESRLGK